MIEYYKWLKSFPTVDVLKDFLYKEWMLPEAEFPEIVIKSMSYFENQYNKNKEYPYSFLIWLEEQYRAI